MKIAFHMNWTERQFWTSEVLLFNLKQKCSFFITGNQKWIYYDSTKAKKSWKPRGDDSASIAKPNIHGKNILYICRDQLGVVYYELLKPNESITGAHYLKQ